MSHPAFTARALRALRGRWLTASEFGQACGRHTSHARTWLDGLVAERIAKVRNRPTDIDPDTGNLPTGPKPREYTLTPPSQWGGL